MNMTLCNFFSLALSYLHNLDGEALLAVNGCVNPLFDTVMPIISMRTVWIPLYMMLVGLIWYRQGWRSAVLCLLVVGLAVGVTDQMCGSILRRFVMRMRPSNPDNPISPLVHIVDGYRGGRYGFPSCHAANSAVVATIVGMWLRHRVVTVMMIIWVIMMSYSRLYLGVHYPGDVLIGAIIGTSIGWSFMRLLQLIFMERGNQVKMWVPNLFTSFS